MFPTVALDPPHFEPLFPLGAIRITAQALALLQQQGQDPNPLLVRHALGDGGFLGSYKVGRPCGRAGREIRSGFSLAERGSVMVVTSADRQVTQILLVREALERFEAQPERTAGLNHPLETSLVSEP
jgi:hypothetical protein